MKIDKNLKEELVKIVLGFEDISKVYVHEEKGLINFSAIRKEGGTYQDLIQFVSKTTDLEIEHNDLSLYFIPYDSKHEVKVLEEIKSLGVVYEEYK